MIAVTVLFWFGMFIFMALTPYNNDFFFPALLCAAICYISTYEYITLAEKNGIRGDTPTGNVILWFLTPLVLPVIYMVFSPSGIKDNNICAMNYPPVLNRPQIILPPSNVKKTENSNSGGFDFDLSSAFCLWNLYAIISNGLYVYKKSQFSGIDTLVIEPDYSNLWFWGNYAIAIWCCCTTAKENKIERSLAIVTYIFCAPVMFYWIWQRKRTIFSALCFFISLPLTIIYYLAMLCMAVVYILRIFKG